MAKKYLVCGIVVDSSDYCRSFRIVVTASTENGALRKVRKALRLSRGDLVRDVSITEIK